MTHADEGARLDPGQSVAVLIGVADYPRTNFPRVGAAHECVRQVAAAFGDETVWGLERPTRLLELFDPDRAKVLRTVADAAKLVGRHGVLLIYFVGHAEPVGATLCLAMRDADRSNPMATMLTVTDLVQAAGGSRADKRILLLDCCYSGRAAADLPGVAVKEDQTAGWYFMGAADVGTQAWAPVGEDLTRFTAALLQVVAGSPSWDDWLTPDFVWQQVGAALPADRPPVHNEIAWALQLPWLKNRLPGPRRRTVPAQREEGAADGPVDVDGIPTAPAFYAEPRYMGSHPFTGRAAQLEKLDDWAAPAEPHPMLLFEAIGGTGKSMLTWEWVTNQAVTVRSDWAGRFWYSFYEKGAVMADFCRRALAYMTGRRVRTFATIKQPVLTEMLLQQLRAEPWLLVLDGLERVLVAYQRYDASQLADEHAGRTDEIGERDPCDAIRPLDDELLRQLAAATPSKILITSRLTPRVLLNTANQPVPGVVIERLPGLRPPDAEALLRACGVRGDSYNMQDFLQRHCDCHPLVTGVIAGLINNYLPGRGNFDRWAPDPAQGGALDLGNLDLVQKRNHILATALEALPEPSQRLLSTLSLLSDAIDYATLDALNPHRPPPPDPVAKPEGDDIYYELLLEPEERASYREENEAAMAQWREYEQSYARWKSSAEVSTAPKMLSKTVDDLERRGLMQYDRIAQRWDLHPVVRATVKARLAEHDVDSLGQQVIDYFSAASKSIGHVSSIDELRNPITVARVMVQMRRFSEAERIIGGELKDPLQDDLEAYPEYLAIVRPMFRSDWSSPVDELADSTGLATDTSRALAIVGPYGKSATLDRLCISVNLRRHNWYNLRVNASNLGTDLANSNCLVMATRWHRLAVDLAEALQSQDNLLAARAEQMTCLATLGRWEEAEEIWSLIEQMDRPQVKVVRTGDIERYLLTFLKFPQGRLTEVDLTNAEKPAAAAHNRFGVRRLQALRGRWRLKQGDPAAAIDPLQEAIRMANEAGFPDATAEAHLALARLKSQPARHPEAREVALRLSGTASSQSLAELWRALGDSARAIDCAKAAYTYAWADGEPYVRRSDLTDATTLLRDLGEPLPVLPPYDAAAHPVEDLERAVAAAIADLARERGSAGRPSTDGPPALA